MTVLKLIYIIAASLLAVYGLQALFLTLIARRTLFDADPTPPPDTEDQPFVTVQLPVFNERHVVRRLIDAVAAFDWPADRLQIQILDDSTDDTSQIIANSVAFHRRNGIDITQIHRTVRTGYKAGALREGLAHARGEFIAIFDADFVPPPDFLQRTISPFDNPEVGCVQARWGHLNANVSRLTLAQSLGIDGHFIVEQRARNDLGALLNFNGTAGLWRRSCMDEAGGWQEDTLNRRPRPQLPGPAVRLARRLPARRDRARRDPRLRRRLQTPAVPLAKGSMPDRQEALYSRPLLRPAPVAQGPRASPISQATPSTR